MHPDVHDTGIVLRLTHGIGNAAATLGVLNPKVTDALVGIGERETSTLGMRERRRVEVQLHLVLLSPLNPALEMFQLTLVTVNELTSEVTIYLVQVQAVVTTQQSLYELNILTYFIDITGTTRIVTCGLNAT